MFSFAVPDHQLQGHRQAGTPPPDGAAIVAAGLHKRYGAVRAVDGLDLRVAAGETVALLGANGAGKTTTVGMLLGLIAPDSGDVRVCGAAPRRAVIDGVIAAMLQDAGLMPGVTVAELIGLGRRLYRDPMPLDEALRVAGVTELAGRRVDRLSGGQAQRVRFALAVVGRPRVLVLDEPTAALDVEGRRDFWAAMRGYAATGRTLLFTSHYLDEVDRNADRIVAIASGVVVADGTPAQIRRIAGTAVVRFTVTGEPPRLPDAVEVDVRGDRVTVSTGHPDAVVRALAASGTDWRDVEVGPASLDDALLRIAALPAERGSR